MASFERSAWVRRVPAAINVADVSLLVYHESHALRDAKPVEYAVKLGDRLCRVAQQRKRHAQLPRKSRVRLSLVNAQGQHLRLSLFKLGETSLVRPKLAGSGWRIGENKKRQDDVLLAAKVAQLDPLACVAGKLEVGRRIANRQFGHASYAEGKSFSRRAKGNAGPALERPTSSFLGRSPLVTRH